MKKIVLNALCILLLTLFSACNKEEAKQESPPPPKVTVYKTEAREVPIYQEFVGQIYGYKDIAISARVEGYLEGVHFEEGSRVKKGELLYTLESQQFEADVAAKMSGVAGSKTVLAEAETYLNRIKPLAKEKAVSESDLDSAVARYEVAISSVKAAEANLRAAKIQLGYTKIYSPISGIIGKTKAKVGDFVGRSPNPIILNTVSRIDTVLVQFFITESHYLMFMRRHMSEKDVGKTEERQADLELILSDGSVYAHKGKADFVNREVDPTTGALLIQASFPNPDELLRPGQFARVRGEVEVVKEGILIPQRCVMELQGTFAVYVVGAENKIQAREVKVGPKIKSFWLIREGLKAGEKVVYEGLQKVKNGTVVEAKVVDVPFKDEEKK
ncbi:MAG: efflux RND transporter periplasmic adaptor subunit [Deltaproteobacteria bacterium]|nr:efflux RND transporter periplasmic adaptor subunit [Deltaproteobacteria bacterium]MBW2352860.1 efflux RND transporter periplasmic adaptor subunit [Deltaproteobacteria bacterium]HDZ90149.1 efflux RND transporter periplasmic adaptor subunit [Deltaproteobacteria bacterium]